MELSKLQNGLLLSKNGNFLFLLIESKYNLININCLFYQITICAIILLRMIYVKSVMFF
jgi:hypothetical protein